MGSHMSFIPLLGIGLIAVGMVADVYAADPNVRTVASRYSVTETIDRIEKVVVEKGMQLFGRIDHAQEAKKVGLEMKPTIRLAPE